MHPVEAERATRRAQVVAALADAVAIVDRAPPIHVAVDGFADPATASWSTTWVVSWPDAAAAATG
jgi:hypothetical protein